MGAVFSGIASLVGLGHILKQIPIDVIRDIGEHLTSGTDPEVLKDNPPLIELTGPRRHLYRGHYYRVLDETSHSSTHDA